MNIVWYGQSFFRISTQKDKNSNIEVAVEPFDKEGDYKAPKVKVDIVIEREGKSRSLNIEGNPFIISNAGEYEIGGVFVQRLTHSPGKSFSLIESEGIKICHLGGNFNQKDLDSEFMEVTSKTDILMISIGNNPKEAAKMVSQIEPKIVIPMNFKKDDVKEFLKVMGIDSKEDVLRLSIKKKDLLVRNGTEVVVLSSNKK